MMRTEQNNRRTAISDNPTHAPRAYLSQKQTYGRILIAVVVAVLAGRCAFLESLAGGIKKPEFHFERVEITGVNLQKLDLRIHASLENPYPFGLPRAATDLGLDLEGGELLRLKTNLDQGVPADRSVPLSFDVALPYAGLMNAYQKVPGAETLGLRLNGPVQVFLPEGRAIPGLPDSLTLDIDQSKRVPALHPSVDIRNFRIIKPSTADITASVGPLLAIPLQTYLNKLFSAGGAAPGSPLSAGLAQLDFKLKTQYELVLANKAPARLDFQNVNYTLLLENQKFFEGLGANIENRGQESVVTVETAFPLRSLTTALSQAIKSKRANFRVSGNAGFDVPAFPLDDALKLNFDQSGKLSWQ